MTFIDEIIQNAESQASIGPQRVFGKGSTIISKAEKLPTTAHAKIHKKTEGSEQSFQTTFIQHSSPSQEGNCCNLKEGEGETSGADP